MSEGTCYASSRADVRFDGSEPRQTKTAQFRHCDPGQQAECSENIRHDWPCLTWAKQLKLAEFGSPGRIRTHDQPVNSRAFLAGKRRASIRPWRLAGTHPEHALLAK